MCNACGFSCCAMDCFEGCGCDGCYDDACWPTCEFCGQPTGSINLCTCDRDEDYDFEDDFVEERT